MFVEVRPPPPISADAGEVDGDVSSPDASEADGTAPAVLLTAPQDGSVGVEPDVAIGCDFSERIDQATIANGFVLTWSSGPDVSGEVVDVGDGRSFAFHPSTPLALRGEYAAEVATSITDLAGNPLSSGHTWSFTIRDGVWGGSQLIETDNVGGVSEAQVAFDPRGSGTAISVWPQSDGTRSNIWSSRYVPGSGWDAPGLVETNNGGSAAAPVVVVDSAGNATAVWAQSSGAQNDIWANHYVVGTGWENPGLIEIGSGAAGNPGIDADFAGNVVAVWRQSDGTRQNVWANRYVPGTGWGTAGLIETDDAGGTQAPRVAVDANGNAVAVWSQSDGTRDSIWSNRYAAGVGWGTAQLLEINNAGAASTPQVAVDDSGNAIAVWSQSDGTIHSIWAARYVVGTGWGSRTLVETDNAGNATNPQIDVAADGRAIAVWSQSDGTRTSIWSSGYLPGTGWSLAALVEAGAGDALSPKVAVDSLGNAFAVWHQYEGTRTDIWVNRFIAGSGWVTAALAEVENAGNAFSPEVAVSRSGTAIAVWPQSDGTRANTIANVFR